MSRATLSPDEALVVRARIDGYSRVDAAALLGMSLREHDEIVGRLCKRFDCGFARVCDRCVELRLIDLKEAAHV